LAYKPIKLKFSEYDGKTAKNKLKVDCWSSSKNDKKPRDVAISCGSKFKFDCDVCGHEFESSLNHITTKIEHGVHTVKIKQSLNYKMRKAKLNGISIIRCCQEDVYNDNNNWENQLNSCITTLVN